MGLNRSKHSVIHRPALFYTASYGVAMNPATVSPLHKRPCDIVDSNISTISPVVGLFFRRSPAAIPRVVSKVVISSVKGGAIRPCAHILNKQFKTTPPLTKSNPPSAVVFKVGVVGVTAPGSHACPRTVCSGVAHSVGSEFKAPAGLSASIFNLRSDNYSRHAADADTKPSGFPCFGVFSSLNNSQSVELLASKVSRYAHNILHKMLFRMKGGWQTLRKARFGFDALATDMDYTSFGGDLHD